MRELPKGWEWTDISCIAESMQNGIYKAPGFYGSNGTACLRMYNIENGKIVWKDIKRMNLTDSEKDQYSLNEGDILVNRVNSRELVGKAARIPQGLEFCVYESKNIRFRVFSKYIDSRLVNSWFHINAQKYFNDNAQQTVGMASISQVQIGAMPFPLPPLNEQKRIADRLDLLLTRIDKTKAHLDRIPLLLKRFRQSVLAAATSGKLTEDWREANGFDLDDWKTKSVADVCAAVADCPHSTPTWSDNGEFCIRTSDFSAGFLDLSLAKKVSKATYTERVQRIMPKSGDILYSREGTVGVACIIPPNTTLCLGQRILLLRPSECIQSTYLLYALTSPQAMQVIKSLTMGSTAQRVNVSQVKSFKIPLPPLEEQHEIVRRVETLFAKADRIEAQYQKARQDVDRLTPALLAKAFRGELVPQDPNDEPASVLLERVKADRKISTTGKQKTAKKKAK